MKNKYSPVSDSDESFKTLIDEKSDIHSSEVTPPPYSAPNKFIDLEMADGSAQHSAQESTNNAGSDSTYSKWIIIIYLFFLRLLAMSLIPKEWLKQTGTVLSNMCANMCVAVICTASLNAPCYSVYYFVKQVIGFEKMDKGFFYFVCIVNVALFVLFWMNPIARERFRLLVINIGNGIGNGVNGIGNGVNGTGNGIRNAANLAFGTNQGDEASQNEEIELQPFAGQSAEV
ncbi:uncharacterized protein SOCG_02081 [Schizosaccharomyces octosporus yFS286]|uniref:Uncharacterized protein n=1 Tax=Schizosaccharomyces octosporus (strain yFS286) TaxID=483514 RepID=S9Q4R0_SCHOY|nr:uncharacterized protein SOCG_02081 [Schizosaccharomyces octosporus yFS286]EPX74598.1 hypothetical protein SOCG_02081 [Schizosaccharomyces octosporus yFS286]